MPEDPFREPRRATAFGVGMIHGVGAETPTQILVFLTASGAGVLHIALSIVIAALSLVVGALALAGRDDLLPTLLAG